MTAARSDIHCAKLYSDEHYRRSSDCSFFVFAQPPGKKGKGSKAKKSRVSKASSRLSSQSVASEAPDLDIDDMTDQSILSHASTKPKSTKKSKSKSKAAQGKQEGPTETEIQPEVDFEEDAQPEPSKPKRVGRGKKRASEDIKDEPESVFQAADEFSQPSVEPPAKKRATKTRSSSVPHKYDYLQNDSVMADAESMNDVASDNEPKKGRKATKKASKSRKVSDVSAASKTLSTVRAPRYSEIDAELEAGLDEDIPESVEAEPEQLPVSKKTGSSKKSKAVAQSPEPNAQPGMEAAENHGAHPTHDDVKSVDDETDAAEPPAPKTKATKGSKKKGTKKAKVEETSEVQLPEPSQPLGTKSETERDESPRNAPSVSVEIHNKHPNHVREEQTVKAEKSPKRDNSASEKKSRKPKTKVEQEELAQSPVDEHDDEFEDADDLPDQLELVNQPQNPSPTPQCPTSESPLSHRKTPSQPPKTTKRYSDIPQEEHLAENLVRQSSPRETHESRRISKQPDRAESPPPHRTTPSISPQSSDAENRPPSSRPSASRPPVQSTPKHPEFRTALTISTPSPSKRNANAGFGPSGHPWTPVDIDEVLFGEASDTENANLTDLFKDVKGGLTSPEKKMTVQEWITWNAKNSEDRLKRECERLVSQFEKEGGRALQRLEAIECID